MADGESLAISVPAGETRVLKYFQERMPYGLFVPDVTLCRCACVSRGPHFNRGDTRPPR
jgi:hypothetical protein